MPSFQEFLKKKAKGTGWKERSKRRAEWIDALKRLLTQIRGFLREADPEGILEIVDYEVERVEERLGVYDAPALRIRLDTVSIDVVPVALNSTKPLSLVNLLSLPHNKSSWGNLSGGRVDVTDGERRHMLLRSIDDEQDHWYVILANQTTIHPLNQRSLEAVLQDLLS